ncbi:tetratricopeptide repeat protein [Odoribacter sp. OttesenSCG-928-J03]|nr:tetratricopeptide repeat protein [Odoribacter sp. OttesenSCG-928-J03]MDL2330685.1 tetratricopeptide repeat protein [Odoribacter sp. OttesenSCG-928-A06]
MRKLITLTLSLYLFCGLVKAQTIDSPLGIDSAQTITNASIYSEYYKHRNYKEALPAWRYVFVNAPKFQLNTYVRGEIIIENMFKITKNVAYIDTLMMVYDQWNKYFGNHPRFGEGYILGKRGANLYRLRHDDPASVKQGYAYLVKSFEIEKDKTHPLTAKITFAAADELYKKNEISKDEYVNLYTKFAAYAKNGMEKSNKPEPYEDVNNTVNAMFFNSGAADCATLGDVLTQKFNQNPTDKDELNSIARLLRRGECTDLPLFAKVSEALYNVDPSAEAAYGLAIMFLKSKDYDKTETYLKEAIAKGEDGEDKAEYYLRYAQIKLAQKQYADAKRNALEALKLKPNMGQAYILIGQAYAAYSKSYGEDEFEHASVFWVAVDKFMQAKQVDPSSASQANELIKSYSLHFPNKEEAFFRGIKEGDTQRVGDWINESTKVRFK